jgi:excisionase family DNA binding protein
MSHPTLPTPFRNFRPFNSQRVRLFLTEREVGRLGRQEATQMRNAPSGLKPGQLTFTIQEAADVLGISKSSAYEAAHRGELPALQFGRRLVVTRTTLEKLLGLSQQTPSGRPVRRERPRPTHWLLVPERGSRPSPNWTLHRRSSTA